MAYKGIPEDELKPQRERIMFPAFREKQASLELMNRFPDVAVYGLLLTDNPDHPLSKLVEKRWSQLHHMTGSRIMLAAFQPPASWSGGLKEFWREKLGKDFKSVWKEWEKGVDAGLSFDYLELFEEPRIELSQLPCLALFTDPQERKAVVRSLPDWDEDRLYKLLTGLFEEVRACADREKNERLECLERSLTSPGAVFRDHAGHLADKALRYLKGHPAKVALTSLSFVLALATANVLPLSATVISVFTIVKDTFSK